VLAGQHRRVRLLFGAADVFLIAVAFYLAYWTRSRIVLENEFYLLRGEVVALLGFSFVIWVAIATWFDMYDRIDAAEGRVILVDAFQQCLLGAVCIVLFQYLLRLDLSRPFLAFFSGYTWLLLSVFRSNAGKMLGAVRRGFGDPRHVMVVGTGEAAQRIGRQLEDASAYGLRLTGFFEDSQHGLQEIELGARYPVYALSALPEMLRGHIIDEIVFAIDSRRLADLEEVFLLCDEEGVRTRVAVGFFPHVNSRVYLDRLGASPLLTFAATPHDELRLLVKRITDLLLGGTLLILLAPVMLLTGLLIRLTSPGAAVFRQERCGLNGRRFTFYKFRSMCDEEVEHLSQRKLAMKIPNDPRLTAVGRWLRKFSIDELPQLWNVVKGDMSLVGPRPALPGEVEQYQRWQRRRLRMRPGLTCLWAVSGRDTVDFETWMRLDMQYIDNWSLALDWKIILRTIPQVLSGRAN
jgi:exopolysaccharide biosynthesis polyprenyl glycosylphosphotransferase